MRLADYRPVMGPRILLATTVVWPSAARLASAFAAVGADVEAVFPDGHMIAGSRYLAAAHRYTPLLPLFSFSRAVGRAAPDLIVPCDDRAVALLLQLAGRGGATGAVIARSLGRLGAYPELIGRSAFIRAARAAGIRAPQTVALAGEHQLDAELARLGFPAVLKADGSHGGDGVAVVRNRAQAQQAFRRLSAAGSRLRNLVRAFTRKDIHFLHDAAVPQAVSISLQSFVPGQPATTAFACWKGRVLAAIHMDVLETLGSTGPASVMRRVDCPDMDQAAIRVAERFGLSGLHGLDFVRDPSGKAHLIEINPRATQASPLALGPGRDLAAALAGCVFPAGARPLLTQNPVIALFPQEWRRNPQSDWLKSAYLDAPWDDPAVLKACLEPAEPVPPRPAALAERPVLVPEGVRASTH